MNFKNMFKKGQSLPLNTIVIAILVILVLLVIIVFFTTQVGETGKTLDEQSVTKCDLDNPVIATTYKSVISKNKDDTRSCEEFFKDSESVKVVSDCCGIRK